MLKKEWQGTRRSFGLRSLQFLSFVGIGSFASRSIGQFAPLGFLKKRAPTPPSALTLVGVNQSIVNSHLNLPAGTQAGDLCVFLDSAEETQTPINKAPEGWNVILNVGNYNHTQALWWKILTAADITQGYITGMLTSATPIKLCAVYRATPAFNSVVLSGFQNQSTADNPAMQTVNPTGSSAAFVILFGYAGSNDPNSPSGTLYTEGTQSGASVRRRLVHLPQQSGSFASKTIDFGDSGNNRLVSWYFEIN